MKTYISLLLLFLIPMALSAQFRMVSNGTPSWTAVDSVTYSATVNFQADQTGNSYVANAIQQSFRVFTGTQQLYSISTVSNATFSSADLTIVRIAGAGAPTGQVMVFNPDGRETVPQVPFGSTGSTALLQAAVVSWNAKVKGLCESAFLEETISVVQYGAPIEGISNNRFSSVTYGQGKFVGTLTLGNAVAVSEDCINWTSYGIKNGAPEQQWRNVMYADGKFVAVSLTGDNRLMTSTDAINWTSYGEENGVELNEWYYTAYGNGKFVSVASSGDNRVMVSEDAINWTSYGVANGVELSLWRSVVYDGSRFVAVAEDGDNRVMVSEDGINWTTYGVANGVELNGWRSIAYGDSTYVATAVSGDNRVMTSQDGINWTSYGVANGVSSLSPWRYVSYVDSMFISVAYGGTADPVMVSQDGINWTSYGEANGAEIANWQAFAYDGSKIVALSWQDEYTMMTSEDGINWTSYGPTNGIDFNRWESIVYGNDIFAAVASSGDNRVMVSVDAINWTSYGVANGVDLSEWLDVIYADGKFVAVANVGDNRVMVSEDGINWTSYGVANGVELNGWHSVVYGNGVFVATAISGDNRVMVSVDAINWTSYGVANGVELNQWFDLIYGNGKFVAVSRNGNNRVMVSEDGINWTSYGVANGVEIHQWYNIAYDGSKFVSIKFNVLDGVMTSTDAVNWTYIAFPQVAGVVSIRNVTYAEGKFFGTTSSGSKRIIVSEDGINWVAYGAEDGAPMTQLRKTVYVDNTFITVGRFGINVVHSTFPLVETCPTNPYGGANDISTIIQDLYDNENSLMKALPQAPVTIDATGNNLTIENLPLFRVNNLDTTATVTHELFNSSNSVIPHRWSRYQAGDSTKIEMQYGEMVLKDTSGEHSLADLAKQHYISLTNGFQSKALTATNAKILLGTVSGRYGSAEQLTDSTLQLGPGQWKIEYTLRALVDSDSLEVYQAAIFVNGSVQLPSIFQQRFNDNLPKERRPIQAPTGFITLKVPPGETRTISLEQQITAGGTAQLDRANLIATRLTP